MGQKLSNDTATLTSTPQKMPLGMQSSQIDAVNSSNESAPMTDKKLIATGRVTMGTASAMMKQLTHRDEAESMEANL
jgi:hypothetical protein